MVTAFSDDAVEAHYTRSIIDPLYVGKLFDTEEDFIEFYLEKNETIQWWYRNGVKSEQFFSIVYVDIHGETQNFFPDFIVRYNDGTLGIFDTKE
jgi:type III restriction enzyme